jgi:hypothetical protein
MLSTGLFMRESRVIGKIDFSKMQTGKSLCEKLELQNLLCNRFNI